MKTVQLSECIVTLKDSITWGDKERIQQCYYKGVEVDATGVKDYDASVVTNARYRAVEVCVIEIKKGEVSIPFSNEWMSNLTIEDGDKLFDVVNEITTPKKSSPTVQ